MYRKAVGLSLWVVVLFLVACAFPGTPWSESVRHALHKSMFKTGLRLAGLRGRPVRLCSLNGRVLNAGGRDVQVLDSVSGWASLSDSEGNFHVPDITWYPGASYDLVVSADEEYVWKFRIDSPDNLTEDGSFSAGVLDTARAERVELSRLKGLNFISVEKRDDQNLQYYLETCRRITDGKSTDDEKARALNEYVSSKLDYSQTVWDPGTPRRVLETGSQYCGNLSAALDALLQAGGYKTRRVNLEDTAQNTHVVVEVFYQGAWHLYDPTFGTSYLNREGKTASYAELRLDPGLITEEAFNRFRAKFPRVEFEWMHGVYSSGYHHYYQFQQVK